MSPQSQPLAEAHKILRSLPLHPTRQDILEAFEGASREAFRLLDETPGRFDENYRQNDWHRIMRIERNDPQSPILDQLRDGPGYVEPTGHRQHEDYIAFGDIPGVPEASDDHPDNDADPIVTQTGKVLTDDDVQDLADEAERGYDPGYGRSLSDDDADAPPDGDLEVTYPAHLEERQDDPSEREVEFDDDTPSDA